MIRILDACHAGRFAIVNSEALVFENAQNPRPVRRNRVGVLLNTFGRPVSRSASVVRRARQIREHGITDMDALHLALAEKAGCGFFVTCDEGLLRRSRRMQSELVIASPTKFVEEMDA